MLNVTWNLNFLLSIQLQWNMDFRYRDHNTFFLSSVYRSMNIIYKIPVKKKWDLTACICDTSIAAMKKKVYKKRRKKCLYNALGLICLLFSSSTVYIIPWLPLINIVYMLTVDFFMWAREAASAFVVARPIRGGEGGKGRATK